MADQKISQLTPAGTLDGSELVELVQSGLDRRTTVEDIAFLAPLHALVKNSTATSINGTLSAVPFDTEVHDVGGWHDNVTNNSRLTVPTGVSMVTVTAGIRLDGAPGRFLAIIKKNGGDFDGMPSSEFRADGGGTSGGANLHSALVEVVPGDYFELHALGLSTFNTRTVNTFLSIEKKQ